MPEVGPLYPFQVGEKAADDPSHERRGEAVTQAKGTIANIEESDQAGRLIPYGTTGGLQTSWGGNENEAGCILVRWGGRKQIDFIASVNFPYCRIHLWVDLGESCSVQRYPAGPMDWKIEQKEESQMFPMFTFKYSEGRMERECSEGRRTILVGGRLPYEPWGGGKKVKGVIGPAF